MLPVPPGSGTVQLLVKTALVWFGAKEAVFPMTMQLFSVP